MDAVRQRLQHLKPAASLQSPALTELGKKVTPYGMELLRAQMSRMLLYSFSETDETDMQGRKIYEVHYKNTVDVTPDLDLDADGQITSFADDRDFGLGHKHFLSV